MTLALLSIAMMTVDHRQHHLDTIRSALSFLVYPIQLIVNFPVAAGDRMGDTFSSHRSLQEENRDLRAQQLFLQSQVLKLEALEAENHRLRALLDSSASLSQPVLIAELLAVDMAPFSRQVVLNKGSRDRVHRGQPIVDAGGVMGQVVEVAPFTSNAMLITDPSHAVPVEVNRNGLRAIAQGVGDPARLELSLLPRSADIVVGDLLVTSGLDGRFPPGYPVAQVTTVERRPDSPFTSVSAEPVARLDSTRVVLLIMPEPTRATLAAGEPDADADAGETGGEAASPEDATP